MKAMVTGATGFLGQHVCMRLNRMGWQVSGLGRNATEGAKLEEQGIRFVQADLRDQAAVVRACVGQAVVFHCGALSSPWGAYRDFHAINVDGTKHVIEGCRKHEVRRLIHISTPSIYFDNRHDRLGVRERDPLPPKPVNAYAATKLLGERAVFQAFATGLSGLILRPRAIFGPLDRSLLPRLIRANESRGVPLFQGGNVKLDVTYVDNVVDAMLLGWEAPEEALGQAYNITNGEPALLRDVLSELFGMLGLPLRLRSAPYPAAYGAAAVMEWTHKLLPMLGEPPLTRYSVGVLARSQTLDIALARAQLGYAPRVRLDDGLRIFAQWWKAEGRLGR
jgi:nucleoside-diphosphate-sugar epimerase